MQAIACCSQLGEGQPLWVHDLHTALDVPGVKTAAFDLVALQVARDVLDWHLQMSQGRCASHTLHKFCMHAQFAYSMPNGKKCRHFQHPVDRDMLQRIVLTGGDQCTYDMVRLRLHASMAMVMPAAATLPAFATNAVSLRKKERTTPLGVTHNAMYAASLSM